MSRVADASEKRQAVCKLSIGFAIAAAGLFGYNKYQFGISSGSSDDDRDGILRRDHAQGAICPRGRHHYIQVCL
jgi:hypothetical protein